MKVAAATLEIEEQIFARGVGTIAGMDEVGRGSLAGPVCVGVALVDAATRLSVEGLVDSKALSEKKREAMVPAIRDWCVVEVGYTQPAEIDALGMTRALRLAGQRALARAAARASSSIDFVLLDGKHDWLTAPAPDLLAGLDEAELLYQSLVAEAWGSNVAWEGPVETVIKGDFKCASIAASSVVAKVERDHLMNELAQLYPNFGWQKNKGYGSATHRQALAEHGPSMEHRLTWNLGVDEEQVKAAYLQRAQQNL